MKRLFFGFILGMCLSTHMPRMHAQQVCAECLVGHLENAQSGSVFVPTWGYPQVALAPGLNTTVVRLPQEPATATHGQHDLSVRDFVEILADYEIRHADQQPFFQPAYGVTNFDSSPPAVWIFNTSDTPSRRSTVIHELLHVYYHQRGTDLTEEFIRAEEDRQYKALFGDGQ